MSKSAYLLGNTVPYVEASHQGGRQRPSAVLLRTSWTTGRHGAANGIAQAWHNPNNRKDSCHYVVDTFQTIQCVPDKLTAVQTMGEYRRAISINVCYNPPEHPMLETLERSAKLAARLCKLYRLPVRILSDEQVEKWLRRKWKTRGGIILNTAGAFSPTVFLDLVEFEYSQL